MNFKSRLAIAAASAAVILSSIVPATFASTNVNISHNGAFSTNTVNVSNTNILTIVQQNFSNIITSIVSSNDTGGNTASFNTGKGGTVIVTGKSTSNITVNVTGSSNTLK